jgi:hypothetical protein
MALLSASVPFGFMFSVAPGVLSEVPPVWELLPLDCATAAPEDVSASASMQYLITLEDISYLIVV